VLSGRHSQCHVPHDSTFYSRLRYKNKNSIKYGTERLPPFLQRTKITYTLELHDNNWYPFCLGGETWSVVGTKKWAIHDDIVMLSIIFISNFLFRPSFPSSALRAYHLALYQYIIIHNLHLRPQCNTPSKVHSTIKLHKQNTLEKCPRLRINKLSSKNTIQSFTPTIHIQYSKLHPSDGRLAIHRTQQRYANPFLWYRKHVY
jgi:hypothetical protein